MDTRNNLLENILAAVESGGGGGLTPDQLKRLTRIGIPLRIDGDTSVLGSGHLGYTNTGMVIDAYPDDGGSVDINVTLPDSTGTEFAVEVDNQSSTDLNVNLKGFGGSTLVSIPPVNSFLAFYDTLQSPVVAAWELMHKQGNPVPQLDPAKYGDFNGAAFSSLKVCCYTVSYLGSQMVNHPFDNIVGGSTYTVQFDQVNKSGTFSQLMRIISTDSDFTNPDLNRLISRGAVDLGSAAAVGWKKHALQSEIPTDNYYGGWFNYEDLATKTTPIPIAAIDGWVQLTNDTQSANTNRNHIPLGISDVWNETTNQFDFSGLGHGDTVDIRVAIEVTTTSPNQEVDVSLFGAIGSGGDYEIPFVSTAPKNAGVYKGLRFSSIFVGDDNTKNFPAEFRILSDGDASVEVLGWMIRILRRP